MARTTTLFSWMLAAAVSASVGACADDDTVATSTSPTDPSSAGIVVDAFDQSFEPANVTIRRGEKVMWRWVGDTRHTVTSGLDARDPDAGASFDFELSSTSTRFEQAFRSTGVFPYFSRTSGATGTITVLD